MNKEIEVRIEIDQKMLDQTKTWLDKNAMCIGKNNHVEYYLNKPATTFFFSAPEGYKDARDYLRVRLTEKGDSFCFKKFHEDPVEKRPLYCDEYEIKVSDGKKMLELMAALGYTDQTLMEKTRTTYIFEDGHEFDCFEVVIDNVKGVGFFMEVELKKIPPSAKEIGDVRGGIALIYDFLRSIGVKKFKLQTRGYISMIWNPDFDFGKMVEL